jgi:hypothetical protein
MQGEFQVLSAGGTLVRRQILKKGEIASYVTVSANGNRFAVAISTFKGGFDLLDISSHEVLKRIDVYDLRRPESIYTMEKKLGHISGFALSPDGLHLVLLRGEIVELFQLPS